MELRDYFAGQAIAGLTAVGSSALNAKMMVEVAYEIADRMLEEKGKWDESNAEEYRANPPGVDGEEAE